MEEMEIGYCRLITDERKKLVTADRDKSFHCTSALIYLED